MEKKIMYCVIVCSIMFWCFAINVKAEENDLIMYDYVHQTEHKYSIGLDRKLQKRVCEIKSVNRHSMISDGAVSS